MDNYSAPSGGPARGACYSCGNAGHQARDCPTKGPAKCYNCGGEGHMSRDCSEPAKDNKSCYKCGQPGHISRDCPMGGGGGGGQSTECYKQLAKYRDWIIHFNITWISPQDQQLPLDAEKSFLGRFTIAKHLKQLKIHDSTPMRDRILQHGLGEIPHSLSYAEVTEYFLGTAKDGIELIRPMEHFDELAHAGLGETAATPDLDRLIGNLVSRTGSAHLQQPNRTREVLGLLLVGHVAHLIGNGLEPGLVGFDQSNHLGEPGRC
ncbi:cellular nucleic acid-binding protein [Ilyonectria robusta]